MASERVVIPTRSHVSATVLEIKHDSTPSLEELHCSFMAFRGGERFECAEIPPFTCGRIALARVETVGAGFQFSDHCLIGGRYQPPF